MLKILGPLELVEGRRMFKIGGPREHVVLATLALRANRVISVEQIMDSVWGEAPPSTARGQIQGCISGLRKLFGDAGLPDAIKTRSSGYLLDLADDDLDSEQFTKLVAAAQRQAADDQPAAAAATLRSALELWRGPALDGIQSDFVQRAASVLEDARLAAAEERVRLELELGRHEEITGELRTLATEHPLRERLYGFLMLALYRSGRQADALEVCRQARATLIAELGIEPGQELRDLERAVLNRDPSLDLPVPMASSGSPVPAEKQSASPRQLPSSIADFIGREDQIAEIRRFLFERDESETRYAVPVVAISGRGGVGKSTLALRVAHELADEFPDGHIYVDLQGPDGEDRTTLLLARFLRALGVSGAVIPEDLAERTEMYRSRLASKRLLLVFDDATSEQQVMPLLPGSPSCAVIVTSRARLVGLPGAHWVDVDAFDDNTSTELLAKIVGWERLRAEPGAADELVKYCGGLPLALRIAGARLASRPHWRIAELTRRLKNEVRRLDELSHRGLELRSSIGLTYRGLPDQVKRLFRLFALVKAPDFPPWTAAALLDTNLTDAEDMLEFLVDAQMLDTVLAQNGQLRYRLHDLIRVYALERLTETETHVEREQALGRVLGAWLALAEQAHRKEHGGDYTILHGNALRWSLPEWEDEDVIDNPMDWLESERGALVSAVRQAAAAGLDELCWDLALTSVSLFEVKGYLDDWRETAELAHNVATRAGNRTGSAAMLYTLGTLQIVQERYTEADEHFAESLEIFEKDGNVYGQGLVLSHAAMMARQRGDVDDMLAKFDSALEKMRAFDDPIGQAYVLSSLARFKTGEGEVDEAKAMLSDALALCRGANYLRGEAQVVSRLAELYVSTGQVVLARRAWNDVLRTVRQIGDRIGEAHAVYGLGIVRRREGRMDSAEATLAHALSIAERVGDRMVEAKSRYALGEIAVARADNPAGAENLSRAKALFTELGSTLWLAKTLIMLSEVHDTAGHSTLAHQDLELASSLLTKVDSKESARLRGQLEEAMSALLADDIVGAARTSD